MAAASSGAFQKRKPMTKREKSTLFTASVALLGAALLRAIAAPSDAADPLAHLPGIADSLLQASQAAKEEADARAKPIAGGERINPNQANEIELDRLPGVGPSLARRIVEDRNRRGPFQSVLDLGRVRGLGPKSLKKLGPVLDLPLESSEARPSRFVAFPGPAAEKTMRINVNEATAAELEKIPGIGPATAAKIVRDREKRGRFQSLGELARVKGIGDKTVERLASFLRAGAGQ